MAAGDLLQQVAGEEGDVAGALPQGGQLDGEDVEAEEEVGAELAGLHHGGQVAVGGGHQPDVRPQGAAAAHPFVGPLLQHPQHLALHPGRELGDLVEEEGAPLGELDAPRRAAVGTGESPLLVAEELVLQQRLGDGGAVERHARPVAARRQGVDRPGEQLLAGAALAGQQDVALLGAHLLEQPEGGAEPRMGAHEGGRPGDAEDGRLVASRQGLLDETRQVVQLQRLLQEVVGAELHRLDRRAHGAVAGEHHHRHAGLGRAAGLQHPQARDVGELEIGEDEVEGARREQPDAGLAVGGARHLVPLLAQRRLQHAPQGVAVLDDQDAARHCLTAASRASSSSGATVRRSRISRPWRR